MLHDMKDDFSKEQLKNAINLQKRIMELVDLCKHDRELGDDDDDDDDDFFEEENPAVEELYMLLEVYKVITGKVQDLEG